MEKCEFISQNQNKGSRESNGWELEPTGCNAIQNSPSATNAFLIVGTELRAALRENPRMEFCSKQLNMRGLENTFVEQTRRLNRGSDCRLI